jgi:hypothetical protein
VRIDTGYMGIAYDEVIPATIDIGYYETHPVADASGLIYWTGPDTARVAPNLTQAQALAAQVIMSGGDTSWSADFYPRSTLQTGGVYEASTAAYTGDTLAQPITSPIAVPTGTVQPTTQWQPGYQFTASPTPPTGTQPSSMLPTGTQPYVVPTGGGGLPSSSGTPVTAPPGGTGGWDLPGNEDDAAAAGGGGGGWFGADAGGGMLGGSVGGIPIVALLAVGLAVAVSQRKRR